MPLPRRLRDACCLLALCLVLHDGALATDAEAAPPPPQPPSKAAPQPAPPSAPVPTFAELEAQGATIGEIRIVADDIFDLSDPAEDKLLFRLANRLHIQTQPQVIRRALLFQTGDKVSARLVDETERLLRSNRYLYDVQIKPLAVHDGVVDIEVRTRDTWSLDLGGSASRTGGANSGGLHLNEYNLFGSGVTVGIAHSKDVDRTSNSVRLANDRIFGSRTSMSLSHATNSDGRRDALSLVRPFYALDTRWAAGLTGVNDNRIDAIYNAGQPVAQYRHKMGQAEAFGGWSNGLEAGWVQRWSGGLRMQDDRYLAEPGLVAPAQLPNDQRLVSPFVRYELLEDRFERELNRNLIGRPEYFALGLNARVELGRALRSLGSTNDAWLYTASVSRGFDPTDGATLTGAASISGQWQGGQARRQRLHGETQLYVPQGTHRLFYAAADLDMLTRPDPAESLLLGGDDGLRGYPLRYQAGTRRALFTVEERFYTDWYVWRLFRIGGAVYGDVGRAWGGENNNALNPGWLSNVGFGLRVVNARSAFSNVIHVDLAMPLNATPDVKKVQFLVKARASF